MRVEVSSHSYIIKSAFSQPAYIVISAAIFTVMLVSLSNASQLLFFEPHLTFYLPQDSLLTFSLIVILSALSGFVISIVIFQIREFHSTKKVGAGIAGSLIGTGAGVCTSCSAIGFSMISTLGVTGATTLSFLETYSVPIRVATICLLVATFFMIAKSLSKKCEMKSI
jgi:hypothetical protein